MSPCPKGGRNTQLQKRHFFNQNILIFFLFLHESIYFGYSLKEPSHSACNEYQNICFHGEIKNVDTLSCLKICKHWDTSHPIIVPLKFKSC